MHEICRGEAQATRVTPPRARGRTVQVLYSAVD
jgi:hypothetical protein